MTEASKNSRTAHTAARGGWDVGVRTTVPTSVPAVWQFLVGPGLALWLGDTTLPTSKGQGFVTDDGVRGVLRILTENSRVRVSWWPSDWPHDTTLTLTLKEATAGTTIDIQHDELADRDERRMMLGHWKSVLDELAVAIDRAS
ncbi:MAG: SRPBCC domain-containing protein [Microbacteriaceae bacterium]